MKTFVIINFDIVGFHRYPDAPEQVSFLRNNHRHIFQIAVSYKVKGLDREKEIFIQQKQVEDYLYESYGNPCQFKAMSCEMIAKDILEFSLEDGAVQVIVLEDGKGGAIAQSEII